MGDSDVPGRTTGGLFDSLRSLIATSVAMAQTRIELFGTEVEEELHRVLALAAGVAIVLVLASLALLFSGLVVVAAYWDTHRVAAAAGVAIGFIALTAVSYFVVRKQTQRRSRLLSATLAELEHDLEQLGRRSSP